MSSKIKLAVLYVTYGNKYPNAKKNLLKYLSKINYDYEFITLDNLNLNIIHNSKITKCNNLNDYWEFGSWEEGINYLNKNNIEYYAVLFVNDSFENPGYGKISDIISNESIIKCVKNKKNINAITKGAELNLFKINNEFIYPSFRSHCFILPKEIIKLIKICPYKYDFLNKCISENVEYPYFKKDCPLNRHLQEHLIGTIGTNWHSAINIEENWSIFRMKTLAFLNEFELSNQLKNLENSVFSKIFENNTAYIQIEDFLIDNKIKNDDNIFYMIGRKFISDRQKLDSNIDYSLEEIYKKNNLNLEDMDKEIKLKENLYFINKKSEELIRFLEIFKKDIVFIAKNPENIEIYKKIFKDIYNNRIISINEYLNIENMDQKNIVNKYDFVSNVNEKIYFKIGFHYLGAIAHYLKCNKKNIQKKIIDFIESEIRYIQNDKMLIYEILKNKDVLDGALDFCNYVKYMNVADFYRLGVYKINRFIYYCDAEEAIELGKISIDGKNIGCPDFSFLKKQEEECINKNIFDQNVRCECMKLARNKYE